MARTADETAPPDDLIGANEAAKMLGCHLSTVYRWIFAGALPAWRLAGRYKVSRQAAQGMLRRVAVPDAGGHAEALLELRRAGLLS